MLLSTLSTLRTNPPSTLHPPIPTQSTSYALLPSLTFMTTLSTHRISSPSSVPPPLSSPLKLCLYTSLCQPPCPPYPLTGLVHPIHSLDLTHLPVFLFLSMASHPSLHPPYPLTGLLHPIHSLDLTHLRIFLHLSLPFHPIHHPPSPHTSPMAQSTLSPLSLGSPQSPTTRQTSSVLMLSTLASISHHLNNSLIIYPPPS